MSQLIPSQNPCRPYSAILYAGANRIIYFYIPGGCCAVFLCVGKFLSVNFVQFSDFLGWNGRISVTVTKLTAMTADNNDDRFYLHSLDS